MDDLFTAKLKFLSILVRDCELSSFTFSCLLTLFFKDVLQMSKPGKVMKDAYFKGILWTRTFVTGPLDPIHNKYKFYCMLCKTNVSIYSKGAREILRHYKTEGHLRRDQKWRFVHLQEIDSTTGVVTHQVRGKDG